MFISDTFSGKPVKIGSRRLREQYLPEPSDSVHARATVNGNLAGTAFACRWRYDDKNICWVTQLVVSRDYRERGLASGLLRSLRMEADDIYGILSSHPAACLAAASSFGCKSNLSHPNADPTSNRGQLLSATCLSISPKRTLD